MNPTAGNTQRPTTGATQPSPEIPRRQIPPYRSILERRGDDPTSVVGTKPSGFISLRPLSEGRSSPLVTGLTALQIEIQEDYNDRDLEGSVI